MQSEHSKSFDLLFRKLVERTCLKWGYPFPNEKYFNYISSRLPEGLRQAISYGSDRGIILDAGPSKTDGKGYELRFEDNLMDIGIYEGGALKACCEVKEKSSKAQELIRGIREYQSVSTLPAKDRGNDPLRKAKYISKLRALVFLCRCDRAQI